MDSARFGRVLGIGARHAAKTLAQAVDAATAPTPAGHSPQTPPSVTHSSPRQAPAATAPQAAASDPVRRPEAEILPPAVPATARGVRATVAAPSLPRQTPPASVAPRGLAEGSRRFGRALWGPAVRLSGVLWLELTGVFFGLFALVALIAVWRLRGTFKQPVADHVHLSLAIGMAVVFSYFCISSFMSASRRSRQR